MLKLIWWPLNLEGWTRIMVANSWEENPDKGPNFSSPREEATCADSSNRNKIASFVSTNNAETTPGCNDALELPNKDGPSTVNNVNSECGISLITTNQRMK